MRSRGYGVGLLGDPRSTTTGKQGPHEETYFVDCEFNLNGTVSKGNGIDVRSADRITLEHCIAIDNRDVGLYIRGRFAALVGCHVVDNNIGIIADSAVNAAESVEDDSYVTVLGGSAENSTGAGLAFVKTADQAIDKGMTHATVVGFNARDNGRGIGTSVPQAPFTDTAISLSVLGGHYTENKDQGIAINGVRALTIQGALCHSNGGNGLTVVDTTQASISGCRLQSNKGWGLYIGSEIITTNRISTTANIIHGNTGGEFFNSGANSKAAANISDQSGTVASASTITLPSCEDSVLITGTTNVTSIAGSFNGRVVALRFSQALTVIKGSNLKLTANFEATAADTLTLSFLAGDWYELSRSVNA
jgi:hypothetical protein